MVAQLIRPNHISFPEEIQSASKTYVAALQSGLHDQKRIVLRAGDIDKNTDQTRQELIYYLQLASISRLSSLVMKNCSVAAARILFRPNTGSSCEAFHFNSCGVFRHLMDLKCMF